MSKYQIIFKVNGKEVSQEAIHNMEKSRYQLVFNELQAKGVKLILNGQPIHSWENLNLEDMQKCLAETKERLGREKILDLYKEELKKGDHMWRDIAQKSATKSHLKPGIVEVETHGITLEQFMLFNKMLEDKDNLYLPSTVHPEHYYFKTTDSKGQIIVERFGQYKYPVYLSLETGKDNYLPTPLDKDTTFLMTGVTRLMSDKSDTKIVGMHQFKHSKDGLKVKLGVFLPEAAPDEMIEGHQWHLMVEFNNALHQAAKMKPTFLQKMMLKGALQVIKFRSRLKYRKY